MHKGKIGFFIILALILFPSSMVYAGAGVKSILDDTRATLEQAAASGFEWSTTRKLIKAAETAQANGDEEKSLRLAKAALNEAEKSLAQAAYAEAHWQDGMPR